MTMQFRDLAETAVADGAISPEEISALRREGWFDGTVDPAEADAIFAVNGRLSESSPEWSDFFVEALSEFIINRVEPKGHVAPEQADWLMARIDHDGRLESLNELELLVRVFERAHSVPPALRDYALRQVEQAVLTGEGPTRCGGQLEKGNVTEAEARLMRRIIFASASERPAAVSRTEAEMLYRIKDAALGAQNSPEWKRLFVQGVGNYLAAFTSGEPLSRERASELEAFMSDRSSSIGGFMARMGRSVFRENPLATTREAFRGPAAEPDRESRIEAARRVDPEEQAWLESRIDGNGRIDEFDQALLAFLEEESGYRR